MSQSSIWGCSEVAAQWGWGRQGHPEHRAVPPPPQTGHLKTDISHHSAPPAAFPCPCPSPVALPITDPLWEVAWPVSPPQCPPGATQGPPLGWSLFPECQRHSDTQQPLSGSASTCGSLPLPAMAPHPSLGHKPLTRLMVTQSPCMGPDHNTYPLSALSKTHHKLYFLPTLVFLPMEDRCLCYHFQSAPGRVCPKTFSLQYFN